MASQTSSSQSEILAMALTGQEGFVPAAEVAIQDRPHTFLSLAPAVSASYPVKSASPATTPTELPFDIVKTRRSSSLSSDGSLMSKKRFLKLGPVHGGESTGGDWSEEVIE